MDNKKTQAYRPSDRVRQKRFWRVVLGILFVAVSVTSAFTDKVATLPTVTAAAKTETYQDTIIRASKNYYVFSGFEDGNEKEKRTVAYVKRFYKTAQAEQTRFGQPASVKLAQAILESNAGASNLVSSNNNHFGMKCFSKTCKKGHCSHFPSDTRKDFFRKYRSAWFSYRDHSKKVSTAGRYRKCHETTNPALWCKCLKKYGYATDPEYPKKLISIINKYKLNELDL